MSEPHSQACIGCWSEAIIHPQKKRYSCLVSRQLAYIHSQAFADICFLQVCPTSSPPCFHFPGRSRMQALSLSEGQGPLLPCLQLLCQQVKFSLSLSCVSRWRHDELAFAGGFNGMDFHSSVPDSIAGCQAIAENSTLWTEVPDRRHVVSWRTILGR